ncbi:GNAT family N-acetyltransferase [Dehalococcoides mccartyi]|nr:GNAT family N-acetyltransferase [Dehalococcoides mccartyi]
MAQEKITTLEIPVLVADDSLVLRPADIDDAEIYLQLVAENYEYISNWIRVPKPPLTVDERRKAQAADLASGAEGKGYWWLIEYENELVGTIALHHVNAIERWSLVGYWLAEEFTGKGLMTRSLKLVIDWAFTGLGLNRVEIQASLNNPASTAIPERLGIRRESIRRQSDVVKGASLDMAIYAALADNWPPKSPARALPRRVIRVDDDILLRPIRESDRNPMWNAFKTTREYLGMYLPWIAEYKTENDHNRIFSARRAEQDTFDGSKGYAIEYRGEMAGTVGFGIPDRNNGIELGYWVRQDLQGRGIVTRSVEAIITMLFVEIGLHRVTIRSATSNLPSRHIPERLGFTHEGTMRDSSYVNGEYLDLEIYSMLDHEWLARSTNA